ncbi:hypothetical protein GKE82_03955 [Conexibacter sp. W3-3-2]|nr:hypothetical protein [Conexibacter sp. W3-3-2]
MAELRVVPAPLPHPVEALQDPARHPPDRIRVLVRPRCRDPGRRRARRQRGEHVVLVLGDRRRVGGPAAVRGDRRRDEQRVRRADRGAQLARRQQLRRERERPRAQAVDRGHLLVERQHGELRVLRVPRARRPQHQTTVQATRAQLGHRRAGLGERPDERGDEQPAALRQDRGIGAQRGVHGGDREQARTVGGDPHRDRGALPRARERELVRAGAQRRGQQATQPRVVLPRRAHASGLLQCLGERLRGHRAPNATVDGVSDWFERYGFALVDERLATGAYPLDAADVARLRDELGVTRVLNLCEDAEYEEGERLAVDEAYAHHGILEHRLQLIDYGEVLPGALEQGAREVVPWLDGGETVYVHCRAGWQRSATVAAAALSVRFGIEPDAALGRIRERKPSAQPLHHQLEGLWRWWRTRQARLEGRG